ncbi:MAG: hypothetical protein M0001_16670 [Treponema sp.]|nr:hypothetical protein [Treponema sp.]
MVRRFTILSALAAVVLVLGLASCATTARGAGGQGDIVTYLEGHGGTLPSMMSVQTVVDMALKSHEASDGSTTSFRWGDLSGKKLYVVSLFPDLGIIKKGKEITNAELSAFAFAHMDLFSDPRVCLGTWFNKDDGNTYIDINVVLADKAKAVELAKRYNQISIFDLSSFEETKTGGDGKPIANLPPPIERLPAFQ